MVSLPFSWLWPGSPDPTEADWRACTDPDVLLRYVRGRTSARKLRLFACACCRRLDQLLVDDRSRQALSTSERYADGTATEDELRTAQRALKTAWDEVVAGREAVELEGKLITVRAEAWAAQAVMKAVALESPESAWSDVKRAALEVANWDLDAARKLSMATWEAVVRDIFGNPVRPVQLEPEWLQRNGGCVKELARVIYEERRFEEMPILADALLDVGCYDETILGHCRAETGHMLGCWLVDSLLGRK